MKYLLALIGDESRYADATPEQRREGMKEWDAFTRATTDAGAFVAGEGLQPSATATTVKIQEAGEPIVTDGPFAETKEYLGGYYELECTAEQALEAAAKCPDIAAVVADSSYATFVDAAKYSFRAVTRVPHFPVAPIAMHWAKVIMHVDASQLRPIDVIGRIAPRPLLLTHGMLDEIVPVRHAYTLFKAADEPKELWVVPGAHHVGARDVDPEGYFIKTERFLGQAPVANRADALLPSA